MMFFCTLSVFVLSVFPGSFQARISGKASGQRNTWWTKSFGRGRFPQSEQKAVEWLWFGKEKVGRLVFLSSFV